VFIPSRFTLTLAGAMFAAALAAPGAGARPIDTRPSPSPVDPTVTRTIDDGIDLGSAALGAGGASAALLLAGAGAAAAMHRKRHVASASD
jgi:hypothetical protein